MKGFVAIINDWVIKEEEDLADKKENRYMVTDLFNNAPNIFGVTLKEAEDFCRNLNNIPPRS